MRLYSRLDAASVTHAGRTYDPKDDGGFDFPEDVAQELHTFHVNGTPAWETQIERQNRLIAEEIERRKDPATLLAVVEQLMHAAEAVRPPTPEPTPEPAPTPAPTKRTTKKTAASA